MKRHEIRQNRISELTRMALQGKTLSQLVSRCLDWKLSKGTISSYMEEVRERIQKAQEKHTPGVSNK